MYLLVNFLIKLSML